MTPDQIPPELVGMMNEAAGKEHSADGHVLTALAAVLTRWDELRADALGWPQALSAPLTRAGWLNPGSGIMHRPKMDLHPSPSWVPVYLYDPLAQFAQADGGAHFDTLRAAFAAATDKVTFTLHTGERVRLVREEVGPGDVAWVLRPIGPVMQRVLLERGVPPEVVRSITQNDGDPA